jgi:hypothetical protein
MENVNSKKIEEKQQSIEKNTVINDTAYSIDNDMLFLTTCLTYTIMGYAYGSKWDEEKQTYIEDNSNFQVQTVTTNNETGEMEKHTIRVNKKLNEEEIEQLLGKTFYLDNVTVYNIKNGNKRDRAYGTTDIGKEVKSENPVFEINAKAQFIASSIIHEKKTEYTKGKTGKARQVVKETGNTIVQGIVKFGTRIDLKNIIVENTSIEELEQFKNKEIIFENIVDKKPANGSIIYKTTSLPKIVK